MKRNTKKAADKPKAPPFRKCKDCGKQAVYMKRNQETGEMEEFCATHMEQIRDDRKDKGVKHIAKAKAAAAQRTEAKAAMATKVTPKRSLTRKKTA